MPKVREGVGMPQLGKGWGCLNKGRGGDASISEGVGMHQLGNGVRMTQGRGEDDSDREGAGMPQLGKGWGCLS